MMAVPSGFTEETWSVAMRFCDFLEWYLDQGYDMDEAQTKAKEAMRVEGASQYPRADMHCFN